MHSTGQASFAISMHGVCARNSNIAAAIITMEAATIHIAVLAEPKCSRVVSLDLIFDVMKFSKAAGLKNNRVGPCGPVANPDKAAGSPLH